MSFSFYVVYVHIVHHLALNILTTPDFNLFFCINSYVDSSHTELLRIGSLDTSKG